MKVKDLLNIPRRWIKRQSAMRDDGLECKPEDPLAVCFCLSGAVEKCYPSGPQREEAFRKLRQAISWVVGPGASTEPTVFNDSPSTDHNKVVRVLELADI